MDIAIERERLARIFMELCELSSPSRQEKSVLAYLQKTFAALGADSIFEDQSAERTGADCGNLFVRFRGTTEAPPIFLACHMDTVNPGENVQVKRSGDIFTSRGETILGGDDKAGIASLVELITMLKAHHTAHRPLELIFTTCEEIGLLGAKALDPKDITAPFGYALDANGIDQVIIGAPAANRIQINVYGTAAHAGMNPEAGLSAFLVAAAAITKLRLGRIDDESTANIGLLKGGVATNIIPEQLMIHGEIRSHCVAKLARFTEEMRAVFTDTAASWPVAAGQQQPVVEFEVESDYPVMRLAEQEQVIQTVLQAGSRLGRDLSLVIAGGGSDANIYNGYGLPTAIIATGMDLVHTTSEQLDLNDLVRLTELLYTMAAE